jgi:hypothetical protein
MESQDDEKVDTKPDILEVIVQDDIKPNILEVIGHNHDVVEGDENVSSANLSQIVKTFYLIE